MALIYLILAALGLGFLIFIHELGHYFVARWVGIRVEVFSIGFGRAIMSWKRGDVVWKVGWLPFGGYVRMAGEDRSQAAEGKEVEGGFYAATPSRRIAVALAGPVVNFLFALIAFSILWVGGGRMRPYAEFSQRIGWLDPSSELYAQGIRPGDRIEAYDGYQVYAAKDHAYGPMLADGSLVVSGEEVNFTTGVSKPFQLKVSPYADPDALEKGITTVGFEAPAQFLYYEGEGSNGAALPVAGSGIAAGDRIVWMDGHPLFSVRQLSYFLNDGRALVTVERNGKSFLARVPRVAMSQLRMTAWMRSDIGDWLYDAGVRGRGGDAYYLPYTLSPSGVVEGRLTPVDANLQGELFPARPYSSLEEPLQAGDRIVAVNGVPVSTAKEVVAQLQKRQVQLIVQRKAPDPKRIAPEQAEEFFLTSVDWRDLTALGNSVGQPGAPQQLGDLVLLKPVTPMRYGQILEQMEGKERAEKIWQQGEEQINDSTSGVQRERQLEQLRQERNRYALGLRMHDLQVAYNPSPATLFARTFEETGRTLRSLFMGDLKPKWLSGPVGIVRVMQISWASGAAEALFWLGFISLNLAILNLLPIPILDGGNIVFSLYEMVTRRKIKPKTMERLIIPFFVLLVGFFIYVTYQDLARLFKHLF